MNYSNVIAFQALCGINPLPDRESGVANHPEAAH
jgi:hypothetical protein